MTAPEEPPVRIQVVVSGRVQGVGYRASCAHRATEDGLGGWVRNRADGRVEAELEGSPTAVEAVLAWCRVGPRWATVTRVDQAPREPEGTVGFTIR